MLQSNTDIIAVIPDNPYICRAIRSLVSQWLLNYRTKHTDLDTDTLNLIQKWIDILHVPTVMKSDFKTRERAELRDLLEKCDTCSDNTHHDTIHNTITTPATQRKNTHKEDLTFNEWMAEMGLFLQQYLDYEDINWKNVTEQLQQSVSAGKMFTFQGFDSIDDLEDLLARSVSWYYLKKQSPQPLDLQHLQTVLAVDVVQDEEARQELFERVVRKFIGGQ